MAKIGVLAAGSWGTALACVLADNGHDVMLWTRRPEQAEEINRERRNRRFLPEVQLPAKVTATSSLAEALSGASAALLAAPTSGMREVAALAQKYIEPQTLLIHAAKGFETESLKRMSQVIGEAVPRCDPAKIIVLSGPSHAEEVIRRCPTTVVVASEDGSASEAAQDLLINSYFRVYTNPDVAGVEIGGALKNIIALACGMSDGLGFGDNAKAALITRGLAEITRMGIAMGANPLTFSGLAGIGDLVVTCTSRHSRNWRAGHALGGGKPLGEVLDGMGMVVEGVHTTKAAYRLSSVHQVQMPIATQLYHVMFDGKSPRKAAQDLLGRGRTDEMGEIALSHLEKWLD